MRRDRSSLLLISILMLAACAGGVILWEGFRPRAPSEEFQRLVGGLGFGPTVELSPCENGFDPRLAGECSREAGPIPAGKPFCPQHASSLLEYTRLRPSSDDSPEKGQDAHLP